MWAGPELEEGDIQPGCDNDDEMIMIIMMIMMMMSPGCGPAGLLPLGLQLPV